MKSDNVSFDLFPNDAKDIAQGALVNFVGKFGRLAKGSFIWIVTILFGTHVLGLYEQIWAIISTLQGVATFGLHRSIVRFIVTARTARDKDQEARVLLVALLLSLAISTVLTGLTMLAADWIMAFYETPDLSAPLMIMALALPFLAMGTVLVGATRALRIMRVDVYVTSIAAPLILLALGSVAGLLDWGLKGLALAQIAMALGRFLLAGYFFRRYFSLSACLRQLKERLPWSALFNFSLPIMINDMINSILFRLDILMLAAYVDPQWVGIYAITRRVSSAILKLPESLDPIFSTVVSDLASRQEHRQLGDRFVTVARWTLIVGLPFLAAVLLIGRKIVDLFGPEMAAGAPTLVVLSIGMTFFGLFALSEPLLIMTGRPYLSLGNRIIWLVTNVLLNVLLIPRYGIIGAALGTSISMNLVNILRVIQVYVIYKIHPLQRSLLKPLCAALVAGLAVGLLMFASNGLEEMTWMVIGYFLCFSIIYIYLLKLLKFEEEDRAIIKLIHQRLKQTWVKARGKSPKL
ncbi:MAG: flippase [Anaerolineae bacterium]|nr:flippase [Anaerolineae bacterium]